MDMTTFRNREDAAAQLARELKGLKLHHPLVLGIPRGGVITAARLAKELGAEVDVALARKLRHPLQPELAIGAVAEDGQVYLNEEVVENEAAMKRVDQAYLRKEREERLAELEERRAMFREVRPAASIEGRSVILTDDGIATGSTMLAALKVVKAQQPREVIVAVPVAPPSTLEQLRSECDRVVCLSAPEAFFAIGQFYEDFASVEDDEVRDVLREFSERAAEQQSGRAGEQ